MAFPHDYYYVIPLALAECYQALGDYATAETYYLQAAGYACLNSTTEAPYVWIELANLYLDWGNSLFKAGEPTGELPIYSNVLTPGYTAPTSSLYTLPGLKPAWTVAQQAIASLSTVTTLNVNPQIAAGGRCVRIDDESGVSIFDYDVRGRTVIKRSTPTGASQYVLTFVYRSDGQLATLAYPSGKSASLVLQYQYGKRGQVSTIPGVVSAMTYDLQGRRASVAYANGATTAYAYDNAGRLTQLNHSGPAGSLRSTQLVRDPVGNLTQIISPDNNLATTFSYDDLHRLVNAATVAGDVRSYAYDNTGNFTSKSDIGAYAYGENGLPATCLTTAGTAKFTYTALGEMQQTPRPWDSPRDSRAGAGLSIKPCLISHSGRWWAPSSAALSAGRNTLLLLALRRRHPIPTPVRARLARNLIRRAASRIRRPARLTLWDDQFARAEGVVREHSHFRLFRGSDHSDLAKLARALLSETLPTLTRSVPEGATKAASCLRSLLNGTQCSDERPRNDDRGSSPSAIVEKRRKIVRTYSAGNRLALTPTSDRIPPRGVVADEARSSS